MIHEHFKLQHQNTIIDADCGNSVGPTSFLQKKKCNVKQNKTKQKNPWGERKTCRLKETKQAYQYIECVHLI